MRKFLTVAAVICVLIWVVNNPDGAAADVRHVINALAAFAAAI